jgi:hypothetical protein
MNDCAAINDGARHVQEFLAGTVAPACARLVNSGVHRKKRRTK